MPYTILAEFVEDRTRRSVLTLLDRAIDRQAEEMAHDLMRDPEFKAEMQELMREAFRLAIQSLKQPQQLVTPAEK